MTRNRIEPMAATCPYCGEPITLLIDCSEPSQRYVEDCEVCCRPMTVQVEIPEDGPPDVWLTDENDA
ncbi:MAG: CPXCG motif-containing cysteine-rich protein [Moraxellaceae bacterium]|nr:CPXCG motif-containing cysteine-rich protein [Moraxellaceae bacterium]